MNRVREVGTCSVCNRTITLKADRTVRHHGAKDGSFPPKNCPGMGLPPKAAASGYDIDTEALAQKMWEVLASTDEDLHPWTEADPEEKTEAIAIVALVVRLAKDNLMAQVMAEFAQKVTEASQVQQFGEEESKPIDAFLDDPSTGMPRLRPTVDVPLPADPWIER